MRLFAGIELDTATRDSCARVQDRLRAAHFDARFEPIEKLHVTLAFLGRVEPSQVPAVESALDAAASQAPAFALAFDKLGAFPHERRPRVIFIGSRAQGESFRNLATALRARYEAMGFSFVDDVVAHVTIARVKGGSARPLPQLDIARIELPATGIALFESLPDKQTTRYVIRHSASLQTAGAG
jgi:2'-5' RNA ligase